MLTLPAAATSCRLSPHHAICEIRDRDGNIICTCYHIPSHNVLVNKWRGLIYDAAAAEFVVTCMYVHVQRYGCAHIANDNSAQLGPWPNLESWTSGLWLQRLQDVGLRYWAQVLSESISTEISTRQGLRDVPHEVSLRYFQRLQPALDWLAATPVR